MRQRRYDFDVLRVWAMFAVIYQHVASDPVRILDHSPLWELSNALVCFATPAVPLFFMISGALLLRDERTADLDRLFRHRLPRIFVPLAVYSVATLLYTFFRGQPGEWADMVRGLFHNPVTMAYWYLYALIPMYLISPFLRLMTERMTDRHWNYLIALWVLLTIGLNTLRSFLVYDVQLILTEHWTLNLNFIGGYLGYFLLGAWLDRLKDPPSRKVLLAVAALVLAVMVLGTRFDTYARWEYSDRFTNYLAGFTMALSVCLFLLAKSLFSGWAPKGKLLPLLAGNSFPVYLLHSLAIGVGKSLWQARFGVPSPQTVPLHLVFFLAVSAICILIAVILSSIPGVCYLFTGQRYEDACKSSNFQALFNSR